MNHDIYIYLLVMSAVTLAIRILPVTLIRRPIKNQFLRSFLFYVPYVTLAVMTFPAIMDATRSPYAGLLALIVGIGLACNKVAGIRACICSEPYSAKYSRLHNNCQILCFGDRVIGIELAKMIIDEFMTTEFEGGRHERRVNEIMDIERRNREK